MIRVFIADVYAIIHKTIIPGARRAGLALALGKGRGFISAVDARTSHSACDCQASNMALLYSVFGFLPVHTYSEPGSFDMLSALPFEMALAILR